MTSRDRLLKALNHGIPDRVPIDLGGNQTGIHKNAYRALLRHLGLKGTIQQGSGLNPLLDLTCLTSLSVNHVSSSDVLGVLADLRGLEDLHISVWSSISAAGLLQLSTLRGLTRLRVESSPETWIEKYGMVLLQNKVGLWSRRCSAVTVKFQRPQLDPAVTVAVLPFA